eukprot:scaffold33219_cov67-Phaeocystis_antarctica.AAC.2
MLTADRLTLRRAPLCTPASSCALEVLGQLGVSKADKKVGIMGSDEQCMCKSHFYVNDCRGQWSYCC